MARQKPHPFRPFFVAAAVALMIAGTFALHRTGTLNLGLLADLEQDLLDWRFQLRGQKAPGPEVVILAADNETMQKAPEVFERRRGWRDVLQAARAAGAKVLVCDVFFTRPEQLLPAALLADVEAALLADDGGHARDQKLLSILSRVREVGRGDAILAEAIGQRDDVILAFHFGALGTPMQEGLPLAKGTWGQIVAGPELPPSATRVVASLPAFYHAAHAAGMATVYEDPATGRVWAIPLARRDGARAFMPLSVAAAAAFLDLPRAALAFNGESGEGHLGERSLASSGGDLLINYRGPPQTFPTIPMVDLLDGSMPVGSLDGKIVLLGYTNLAQDTAATPFGSRMPGLEVHANAIDSLLRGDVLRRTPPLLDILWTLGFGLLLALLFVPGRLSPQLRVFGLLLLVLLSWGVALVLFQIGPWWAPMAAPAMIVFVPGAAGLMAAYLEEGRGRRQLRRAFARYLSDDLLDELVKDPARASLQGQRRHLSILFTDIRSFTTWSEAMEPLDLAHFLNHFFTPMSAAVLAHKGFLDKYIGDAIMAVFGAPLPRPTHAADACRCAVAMYQALLELQPGAAARGIDLNMGVGINTGDVVVGNLGSEARFDYTVIGDPVNLASRIEGLTKRYGLFCLVGEKTRQDAGGSFVFRAIDLVRVKGKQQPEAIYELCLAPYLEMSVWDDAITAWRRGDHEQSALGFKKFLSANDGDGVAKLYLERLHAQGGVFPDDWDGVFVHDEK